MNDEEFKALIQLFETQGVRNFRKALCLKCGKMVKLKNVETHKCSKLRIMVRTLLFVFLFIASSCSTVKPKYLATVQKPGLKTVVLKTNNSEEIDSLFFVNFGSHLNAEDLKNQNPPVVDLRIGSKYFYCQYNGSK